ncbi:hypothetical protein ACQ4PT_013151 [Festuca glaucescens]
MDELAIGPVAAVLKLFDVVHGLETPLLQDAPGDFPGYLTVLKPWDSCPPANDWSDPKHGSDFNCRYFLGRYMFCQFNCNGESYRAFTARPLIFVDNEPGPSKRHRHHPQLEPQPTTARSPDAFALRSKRTNRTPTQTSGGEMDGGGGGGSTSGEDGKQEKHLVLANKLFLLSQPDVDDLSKVAIRADVLSAVKSDDMAALFEALAATGVLEPDAALLAEMRARIDEEIRKLDEKIADAEENLGESEVREAHLAKSLYFVRVGEKEKALEQLKVTEGKTVAIGQKMDLVFYTLQIGLFYMDFDLISKSIDKAKKLFEEGGDWERKNRLKVYEGLYCMATRNFKKATSLFLDSISTFTTYELFPYDTFIFYTVLTSIISLDRVSLKQKVVDAPEILAVIGKVPHLSEFLNSLYNCQYKSFFVAFSGLTEQIKLDRYLQPHFRYYMREVRTVVYSQFLESYKSVTMEAMASAFGVTVDFIDQELSRFIAAGKLHCKIDKVAGVLETNRPDERNAFYQSTIKQGDFLLNRIQKLSRVIDL